MPWGQRHAAEPWPAARALRPAPHPRVRPPSRAPPRFSNRIVAVLTRQRALHRELLDDARRARSPPLSAFPSFNSGHADAAAHLLPVGTAKGHLAAGAAGERYASAQWAAAIQQQLRDLRAEAALIRASICALLCAILLFLAAGVLLASAGAFGAAPAERAALVLFSCGLAAFALAIVLMLTEAMLITSPLATEEAHLRRIISTTACSAGGVSCAASHQHLAPLQIVTA